MSRIAKSPIKVSKGVDFKQNGNVITLKGAKGELSLELNSEVELNYENDTLNLSPRSRSRFAQAITGTTRSLIANMVHGVTEGYEKKL